MSGTRRAKRGSFTELTMQPCRHPTSLGASRLTVLVFSLILGAIFYFLYQVVPYAYSYFEMHNQMVAIIPKADSLDDKKLRKRLMGFVKELDIPAEDKQLVIERRDRRLKLRLDYVEIVYAPWVDSDWALTEIDLYEFPVRIEVEGAY